MFDLDEYAGLEYIVKILYKSGQDIEEIIKNLSNGEIPLDEEKEKWC